MADRGQRAFRMEGRVQMRVGGNGCVEQVSGGNADGDVGVDVERAHLLPGLLQPPGPFLLGWPPVAPEQCSDQVPEIAPPVCEHPLLRAGAAFHGRKASQLLRGCRDPVTLTVSR